MKNLKSSEQNKKPSHPDAYKFSGFHKLDLQARREKLAATFGLSSQELSNLDTGLSHEQANAMIENVVGRYNLPFGVATNFLINNREYIVPMVVEEPSIVAAVSYAARLARLSGGFKTSSSQPLMIGQIQILDVSDHQQAIEQINSSRTEILHLANQHHPTIRQLGGGAKEIEVRRLPNTKAGPMLILHLIYDSRDAMGANAVNTAVEAVAPYIETLTGGRVNLRILSNLTDRRTARAECKIPVSALSRDGLDGQQVAKQIFEAWAFAAADPYRAATHNKGIMNGIDAVALATGNDWRAIEAGAHAYAARHGSYSSLSEWSFSLSSDETITHLRGILEMPLSVGTVGGATRAHPTARVALKILRQPDARTLAEIMASVGLAQNFAAMRALATEGIQQGHMRLHARQVALAAGAQGAQIQLVANQLVQEGNIREQRARQLLADQPG
jgi:hydroxymethylglutaryl-CoA reductase